MGYTWSMSRFGLTRKELAILQPLTTPRKIQDFLETLPRHSADTCLSPRGVLRERRAHCIEGAMLAALALRLHGHEPLIMDIESVPHDLDHVVAVFRQHGCWGAISKTNHAVLRYREPIYRTLRELALSFFHEYFDDTGVKTMRTFSRPINLKRFDAQNWMTSEEEVWFIPEHLTQIPHISVLSRAQIATLRKADPIERDAGRLVQWKDS